MRKRPTLTPRQQGRGPSFRVKVYFPELAEIFKRGGQTYKSLMTRWTFALCHTREAVTQPDHWGAVQYMYFGAYTKGQYEIEECTACIGERDLTAEGQPLAVHKRARITLPFFPNQPGIDKSSYINHAVRYAGGCFIGEHIYRLIDGRLVLENQEGVSQKKNNRGRKPYAQAL